MAIFVDGTNWTTPCQPFSVFFPPYVEQEREREKQKKEWNAKVTIGLGTVAEGYVQGVLYWRDFGGNTALVT